MPVALHFLFGLATLTFSIFSNEREKVSHELQAEKSLGLSKNYEILAQNSQSQCENDELLAQKSKRLRSQGQRENAELLA